MRSPRLFVVLPMIFLDTNIASVRISVNYLFDILSFILALSTQIQGVKRRNRRHLHPRDQPHSLDSELIPGKEMGERRASLSVVERSGAGLNEASGMVGFSPLSESLVHPLITASSARTRPSPGIHACKRRSARVPKLTWLELRSPTRQRDWRQAIGAW
jgi:hypothetical protein